LQFVAEFQVFYVSVKFYSPYPKSLTLSRQRGSGDWLPWQHYADDCQRAFSLVNNGHLARPDDVNCLQFETLVSSLVFSRSFCYTQCDRLLAWYCFLSVRPSVYCGAL